MQKKKLLLAVIFVLPLMINLSHAMNAQRTRKDLKGQLKDLTNKTPSIQVINTKIALVLQLQESYTDINNKDHVKQYNKYAKLLSELHKQKKEYKDETNKVAHQEACESLPKLFEDQNETKKAAENSSCSIS